MGTPGRWFAVLIGLAALGMASFAEGFFFPEGYQRLEAKWFDGARVAGCTGDFLVYEEYEPEPAEPYLAILSAPGFREGATEGDVRVRVERGRRLEEYVRQIGPFSNNYHMVFQEAGGTLICGLAHNDPSLFVDLKEKRIDVRGTARPSAGEGSVMGGGSGAP